MRLGMLFPIVSSLILQNALSMACNEAMSISVLGQVMLQPPFPISSLFAWKQVW